MIKPFDPKLPVQTRDGRKARIICTDRKGPQPIAALIEVRVDDKEEVLYYSLTGSYFLNCKDICGSDLINIPEAQKWRAWRLDELPLGAFIRSTDDARGVAMVVGTTIHGTPQYVGGDGIVTASLDELFDRWTHSTDGGKTWSKCGILES